MSYCLRNKKFYGGPKGDAGNEATKRNPKADKTSVLKQNKSNLSKVAKTKITDQMEVTTIIKKNATQFENINYNLDVFGQNIQESEGKFNKDTILMVDMGNNFTSSKNEYRVVCKIGFGGSCVVFLVIDKKSKEFKVAKVFKFGQGIRKLERDILHQTSNHPNILRFYEEFLVKSIERYGHVAIYEPLGKDLYSLMKEAAEHGGLSISIVKKVAKHVLLALKAIHGLKVLHSDIKLQNIAPCVSQASLCQVLEKVVKSRNSLSSLRLACQKSIDLNENNVKNFLEKELDELSKLKLQESTQLTFKLIDFGNVMKEGTESPTGTYGFLPPEYFFGSPLLSSHDIWSLGVTIVVLVTNNSFLENCKSTEEIEEITALRNMFGKFSRRHFKGFKDPAGRKTKFSTRFYTGVIAKQQLKKVLQNKFDRLQMGENDRKELVNFLLQMLNTIPTKRKSAAELLLHPWLNDPEVPRKTNIKAVVTPEDYMDTSSPINSNDAPSGIPLDDLSIDEQMGNANSSKRLPSADPKSSKDGGEDTRKTKKAPARIIIYDSFIDLENGQYYLYHKYWRLTYSVIKKCFTCPGCRGEIKFEPKIGFVMVSTVNWHKNRKCTVKLHKAPPMKRRGKNKFTKEDIDSKRESLINQGYKPFEKPKPIEESDAIDQKEAENYEGDDYDYDADSDETEYGTDSDLDETEEDSIKTISEFGSGESYVEDDTLFNPLVDSSDDDEFNIAEWSNDY